MAKTRGEKPAKPTKPTAGRVQKMPDASSARVTAVVPPPRIDAAMSVRVGRNTGGRLRNRPPLQVVPIDMNKLIEQTREGKTLTVIAAQLGVDQQTLRNFLTADPERRERWHEARRESAHAIVDLAEDELRAIKSGSSQATITRAMLLASHLRWKATKLLPAAYGQRLDSTVTVVNDPLAALLREVQERGSLLSPARTLTPIGSAGSVEVFEASPNESPHSQATLAPSHPLATGRRA